MEGSRNRTVPRGPQVRRGWILVWCVLAVFLGVVPARSASGQDGDSRPAGLLTLTATNGLGSEARTRPRRVGPSATRLDHRRLWWGSAVAAAADGAALVALSQLWYADYDHTRFHWHDDLDNWLQQDKLGHLVAAQHIARVAGAYGRWSGLGRRGAAVYGGAASLLFLSQVEVLDGFSVGWGASWADLAANGIGAALGAMQVADPDWEAVTFKWSYSPSPYRDEALSLAGNALKDYDGATFWLVARPADLVVTPAWWPDWLAVAVGHSADGLSRALPGPDSPHRRVWLIAPDLDLLARIAWPRPWMRTAGKVLSFVRLPAPALQLSPRTRVHLVYF